MTPVEFVLSRLPDAKSSGDGWVARCPAHDDQNPSLSIHTGDDGRALMNCHAGCTLDAVCGAIGLRPADLFNPDASRRKGHESRTRPGVTVTKTQRKSARDGGFGDTHTFPTARDAVADLEGRHGARSAEWTYCDADGRPVGLVVRWDTPTGKDVRPVSKKADGSGWYIGGMPLPRPLYRLPELLATLAGTRVFVAEGEKTADAGRAAGLTTTTSPHGSNSASKADWSPLAGRDVVILPDHDDAGERYADDVARLVTAAGAKSVRIVRLVDRWTDLPKGGDLADLTERTGGDADPLAALGREVVALAEKTEPLKMETKALPDPPLAWRPFPVDALPDPMRTYILPTARRMDVDPIFLIAPALTTFSGAVGNSVRVVVREGWIEPSCLWTGLIALPGSLKTQTQDAATEPMHDAQRRADMEYDDRVREYERACDEREAMKKHAKGHSAVPPPAPPAEPLRRQWLVGDTTPEALAHVLKANPRGVVAVYDELGALFGGFGRYSGGRNGAEPGAAFYKSAFNGKTYVENRKGENGKGRYMRVEAPLVSIAGALQPDAFQRLITRQYVEDGLASRFLWAWPPDRPGGWVEERADAPEPSIEYAAAYARLCAIPLNIAPDGKLHPFYIGLSRPAQELGRTWVNALRERITDAPDNAVRAALAKLKGVVFRIALLFHVTDWAGRGEGGEFGAISTDTLQRAIVVADWFAREAARVYAMLAETAEEGEARRLVDWMRGKGGTVTVRDLTHGLRAYRGNPDTAEKALSALVEAGMGHWEIHNPGLKGGRSTQRFHLISAVSVTETTTNTGKCASSGDGDTGDTHTDAIDGWGAEGEI